MNNGQKGARNTASAIAETISELLVLSNSFQQRMILEDTGHPIAQPIT
jgi:hypothetical protein